MRIHCAIWLCVSVLLASIPGWATQTQLDSDTFNGTNGTQLPTYNAKWNAVSGGSWNNAAIEGTPGVGLPSGIVANYNNGQTWTNDQWSELQVDGTNIPDATFGYFESMVRVQTSSSSGYTCGVNRAAINNIYRIGRYDSASFTSLLAEPSSTTIGASDVVNCQIVGTVITMTVTNGGVNRFAPFTYDTASDATKYSTGNPGLLLGNTSTGARLGGSWRAGSATAGGGGGGAYSRNNMLIGVGR